MAGRPPIPTEVHKQRGTYNPTRHGRDRAGEPRPSEDLREKAPAGLTAKERQEWQRQVRQLPRGVVKQLDQRWLLIWVKAAVRHDMATAALMRSAEADPAHPFQVAGARGGWQPSPLLTVIAQAEAAMKAASTELGFSPVSRTRIRSTGAAATTEAPRKWGAVRLAAAEGRLIQEDKA